MATQDQQPMTDPAETADGKRWQQRERSLLTAGASELAKAVNPLVSSPSAPLQTQALVDAYGASLMPRATMHQGMAAGLAVLAAGAINAPLHWAASRIAPENTPIGWRLLARGGLAAAGYSLANLTETEDEHTLVSTVRSLGDMTVAAALGGMVFEATNESRVRFPAKGPVRPLLIGAAGVGYTLYRSSRSLKARSAIIQRWTDEDKPASLVGSVGIGAGVTTVGVLLAKAFRASGKGTADFFGPDLPHQVIGRAVNAALWGAGAAMLYNTGVSRIARANEKIEPAYDEPPSSPHVSGGPASESPFEELGLQGRRFVTDVVTRELIEETLDEPAVAEPVRAYVGVNSEPVYPAGRSEMMCDEMERLGAFERSHLLLFSPTGTGWVDQAVVSAAELFTRGDMATACVQYGRSPSFLAVQTVALGRSQFRLLMWSVKQRLAERPPERRPKVFVFGESLGAWASSDIVMRTGIEGLDHYGIDRALWFGLPGLAKWSRTGMREGRGPNVPPGTVGAFDRPEQFAELTQEQHDAMRAVILDHDNDPIALMSPRLAVKRPPWLEGAERGRNVPEQMDWIPGLTLVQVIVDAMNAMRTVPGEFKSFGHDYRGDTAAFVHGGFGLPAVTPEQFAAVQHALVELEVARGERLKAAKDAGVGDASTEVQ
ncbi:MAG: alpha/beta-hydrolase family protein [Microthrixaceae bacterium]